MAFVITNNDFTHDSYNIRTTRLSQLSERIDHYQQELQLEAALLAWAQAADAAWEAEIATQSVEQGERFEAFQTAEEHFDDLQHRIVAIKEMLLSRYGDDDEKLRMYGLTARMPRKQGEWVNLARDIKAGHDELKAQGDPDILPDAMIDNLYTLSNQTDAAYKTALTELSEAKVSTQTLSRLFDSDTNNLRKVYTWVTGAWGKYDPRLIDLGFVQSKKRRAGYPAAPTGLACDVETDTFSWDETHLATSYQLAYREYIKPDPDKKLPALDWEEAYQGADTSVVFDPGVGDFEFKVRARNKHGFGDFSEVLLVNFSGGALAAPSNFKFDEAKQLFTWDKVTDADSYQLEYSRDGGQTWTMKYDGAAPKFDATDMDSGKWLFRVRALNAMETSPWGITLVVWIGLPAIPKNLRWHPEEYHGDMFAKIEWDAAAGATEYELSFSDNGGDIIDVGADLFKYEDIMGTPRTYRYKVRGKNAFGVSDWSEEIVIVVE